MQVLYVDTLLISNMAMNYLSLGIAARLLHRPVSVWRRLLAALIGGIYAVLAVVLSFPLLLHLPALALLSALLLLTCFGKMGGARLFVGGLIVFLLSNFLLGGATEALFSYMERAFGVRTYFGLKTADLVLVVGFLSYFIIKLILRFFTGAPLPDGVMVRFVLGSRSLTLPLLVDSGCFLSDPISGKAAVLVSADAMEGFLPKEMFLYVKGRTDTLPDRSFLERRIRLLPSESVGGKRLLTALRLDEVSLVTAGEKSVPLDVLVAFTNEKTSFGGYRGILPARVYAGKNDMRVRRRIK